MSVCVITGSAGLVGSESAKHFASKGMHVVGIDNDMRQYFFGADASTNWKRAELEKALGRSYEHHDVDIRNMSAIEEIFVRYSADISAVIHTAAQPSHDWAAKEPHTDFAVNATGTLNVLEAARRHATKAPFVFTSTNKVYGDAPNSLPLQELETRWEIDPSHAFADGIDESMSIDRTLHSLFGASKVAADVMVQEYGRYFDMPTVCFRGGCLTGPSHSGAELHGFLAYLMKCASTGKKYTCFGYKAKQVRDNIHSNDLVKAFDAFMEAPRVGEVYNIGGGRQSNCSMLEAIEMCEEITGRKMNWEYSDENRTGDHIWWIGSLKRFQEHYPDWSLSHDVRSILKEIHDNNVERWAAA